MLTKPLGTQICSNIHVWLYGPDSAAKFGRVESFLTREEAVLAYETSILSMSRLNKVGAELMVKYGARAATDVTGFGLFGHAQNLATNQTLPVQFVIHTVPVIAKTQLVDEKVPYRLLKGLSAETSGGLLFALPKDQAIEYCKEIEAIEGWPCWIVGDVIEAPSEAETRTAQILTLEQGLKVVECPWKSVAPEPL